MDSRGTSHRITDGARGAVLGFAAATVVFQFQRVDKISDAIERLLNEEEDNSASNNNPSEEVTISATVLIIFMLLLVLTIGFDIAKERLRESAGRHMRPIIGSLFGQLTVLGFLALFTFVLAELGVFRFLSEILFGEGEENAILEIFEYVHFSLFFVMIVFVIQVLEAVKQGLETEKTWLQMDRLSRDPEYVRHLLKSKERKEAEDTSASPLFIVWDHVSPYLRFLPQMRNKADESLDDMLLFYYLRDEFIKERSVDPPFHAKNAKNRLGYDFNYGRYLSVCFGIKMSHVVEVDPVTWVFFGIFGVVIFGVVLAVKANFVLMSWIWVLIGYSMFAFNVYFETHLLNTLQCFVPAPDYVIQRLLLARSLRPKGIASSLTVKAGNEKPLVSSAMEDSLYVAMTEEPLPAWCFIDITYYEHNRSWLSKLFSTSTPNRQQALFWLETNGSKLHLFILRINLVFVGLYTALLVLVFFPTMYNQKNQFAFFAFAVMSVIPMLAIIFNKKHLISTMVQVGSIGSFRLPQAVAQACREEKTAQCVRTLVIVQKLHRAAQEAQGSSGDQPTGPSSHYRTLLNHEEVTEVSKTFDLFDESGDGQIDAGEFVALMQTLGIKMDTQSGEKIVEAMDTGGDGEISKEEFLQWYANLVGKHDGLSMKERARFLFRLFDKDGNGDLSVSEFKGILDTLNTNFSIDEVGEMIKELDINDDGTISEHEFVHLLERYYPEKLDVQDESQICAPCDTDSCSGCTLSCHK